MGASKVRVSCRSFVAPLSSGSSMRHGSTASGTTGAAVGTWLNRFSAIGSARGISSLCSLGSTSTAGPLHGRTGIWPHSGAHLGHWMMDVMRCWLYFAEGGCREDLPCGEPLKSTSMVHGPLNSTRSGAHHASIDQDGGLAAGRMKPIRYLGAISRSVVRPCSGFILLYWFLGLAGRVDG